jgi:RNA-directed DNA polymerase
VNRQKTRILHRARRQRVTGVVVNQVAGLSRRDRRRLRATIHQIGQGRLPADPKMLERLTGQLAYLHMLNPAQAAPLRAQLRRAIEPDDGITDGEDDQHSS